MLLDIGPAKKQSSSDISRVLISLIRSSAKANARPSFDPTRELPPNNNRLLLPNGSSHHVEHQAFSGRRNVHRSALSLPLPPVSPPLIVLSFDSRCRCSSFESTKDAQERLNKEGVYKAEDVTVVIRKFGGVGKGSSRSSVFLLPFPSGS
jgi:hypothetical protein